MTRWGGQRTIALLLACFFVAAAGFAQSPGDVFVSTLGELREASFADKEAIADRLLASGHPSAQAVMTALLEDRLYTRNADQAVFIVKSVDDSLQTLELIDPATLKSAGTAPRDDLARIGTNNRLRRMLRISVSRFALSSPDPAVRLNGVREMVQSLDDSTIEILKQRQGVANAGCYPYDFEVRHVAEQARQRISHDVMVIDHQNSDGHARLPSFAASLRGRMIWNSVNSFGRLSTVSCPPCCFTMMW